VTFRIPDDLHEKVILSIERCTILAAIVFGERGLLLVGVKSGRDWRTLQSQLLNLSFLALPRSMEKTSRNWGTQSQLLNLSFHAHPPTFQNLIVQTCL
jgi:hypothetical protein